jgi:hypothetical protein
MLSGLSSTREVVMNCPTELVPVSENNSCESLDTSVSKMDIVCDIHIFGIEFSGF